MKTDTGVNYRVFDTYVSGRKLRRVTGLVTLVVFETLYLKLIDQLIL